MNDLIGREVWLDKYKIIVESLSFGVENSPSSRLGEMNTRYETVGNMSLTLHGSVISEGNSPDNNYYNKVDSNKKIRKSIEIKTLGVIDEGMSIDLKIDGKLVSGLVREKTDNTLKVIILKDGDIQEIKVNYNEETMIPY